jgi:hypothetical protein
VTTTPHQTGIVLVCKQSWRSTGKIRTNEMADNANTNTIYYNGTKKTQTQIKCIQINLQHSRVATDNLVKVIEEDGTDIHCIHEPYTI